MTTVNAIRFNKYCGAIIGDESISTSADLNVYAGDKVQPVIPDDVVKKYGSVIAIGATGSCAVGDDIKHRFKNYIRDYIDKEIELHGKMPDRFLTMDEMSESIFKIVCDVKSEKLSLKTKGTYGFTNNDLIQGSYKSRGKTVEIKDKNSISEALKWMTWKDQTPEADFVFMNAGLMAGYTEEDGFQIVHYDFREGFWYRMQTCYLAEGSGRHSADPNMYPFVEQLHVNARRGNIDPVEGIIAMISAINASVDHEVGVDGYYNIIVVDGQKQNAKRMQEINDHRAYLASQVVRALDNKFISFKDSANIIEKLLFKNGKFEDLYSLFNAKMINKELCSRKLRGYKQLPRRDR